jgi:4-hydroxy-tetrahydrodipicolinate reductase
VRFSNWYCTTDVDPAWDLRPTGWRVRADGEAFDVDSTFPSRSTTAVPTPAHTANRPVNAVLHVWWRRPASSREADLPPITPAARALDRS